MRLVKLLNCVVVVIICYILDTKASSAETDCVPLENCTFAVNILSKNITPDIQSFLKNNKCDLNEDTDRFKIWCTKFISCKTPNSQYGTCIPAKSCAFLVDLLNINMTVELNTKHHFKEYHCSLSQKSEVNVCCPSPGKGWQQKFDLRNKSSPKLSLWNQEGRGQKKRNADQNSWFMHNSGNNFFDTGHSDQFNQHFHNHNFIEQNNSLGKPYFDFGSAFAQQNNHFFNKLTSSQVDFGKGLQHSQREQSKGLQSALENNYKNTFEATQNTNNQFLNWWSWLPARNGNSDHTLNEETSDFAREICMTPDNFEGTCKQFRQCPSFLTALGQANTTDVIQTAYLKKFRCTSTNSSDPKVCCSENIIVLPSSVTRPIVESNTETQDRNSNPLDSISNICGRQIIDDKIIGGTATALAEFPWTALLEYTASKGLSFGCAGSVISNRYIVTAAHCVNADILRQAGLQNLQKIILGEHDTRNETDCIYTRYGSDCADPPQTFSVERIIEHELFKFNATPHDIALVRVDKDITFSNFIRPICLPIGSSINLNGNESFTITGWGRTETGDLSPFKRKAKLPFVNKKNCGQLGPLTDGQMCLGSGKGIDSCKGDSGGPVMHTAISSNDPVTTLLGVISFGFGRCGTTTSVSTYVPHYLNWILKNIS